MGIKGDRKNVCPPPSPGAKLISITINVNTVSCAFLLEKKGMIEMRSWHGSHKQTFVFHNCWSERLMQILREV